MGQSILIAVRLALEHLAYHLIEWMSNYYDKQKKDSIKNFG